MKRVTQGLDEYERGVGKRLRLWRLHLKHSQSYLASLCGMDTRVIAAVELGKRRLTVGELALICDALQIPAAELVPTTWGPARMALDQSQNEKVHGKGSVSVDTEPSTEPQQQSSDQLGTSIV